jgi:hypothetical protein
MNPGKARLANKDHGLPGAWDYGKHKSTLGYIYPENTNVESSFGRRDCARVHFPREDSARSHKFCPELLLAPRL